MWTAPSSPALRPGDWRFKGTGAVPGIPDVVGTLFSWPSELVSRLPVPHQPTCISRPTLVLQELMASKGAIIMGLERHFPGRKSPCSADGNVNVGILLPWETGFSP